MTQTPDNNETRTLVQIIQDGIEKRLADLHISLPAEIVSYDGAEAEVQPLIRRQLRDGTILDLPPITNVPVIWPRTANSVVILPLKPKDTGTLLISERSLDIWLVEGGMTTPEDPRKFNLSDAQFFPGLVPFDASNEYDPDRIVIRNGDGKIVVNENGKIALGKKDGDELVSLVSDIAGEVSKTQLEITLITVPTLLGPSGPPINSAAFLALKAAMDSIKAKIDAIKDIL